jgi:MATE family multidrug resistance protein
VNAAGHAGATGFGRVFRLSLPIILSNLSIPLMGAVDTAVMGHLPDAAYIGGVALGALFFAYVYWGFSFLRMATTGFVAQAHGAQDHQELRHITARGAMLALALGAVIVALQLPLTALALAVLEGSARVKELARDYILVRIWGAPAALMLYVAMGWFIGMQRMRTVLVLTVFQNALNAALALLFVVQLGWGIEGVAGATLIAEYAAAVGAAAALWGAHRNLAGRWGGAGLLDRAKLLSAFRVNRDIFVRTLCLVTGFAWFVSQGAGQGDVALAANAILVTFITFAAFGLDGFAHAAETLAGAAIGARDGAAFRAAVRVSTWWAAGVAVAAAIFFFAAGPAIIDVMTGIGAVREAARVYLPWAAFYPLVAVWCFQLDGIYIGATRTGEMRNGMALATAGFLALGYALMPAFGNHGLWAAFTAFAALRGLILGWWYPRLLVQFARPA